MKKPACWFVHPCAGSLLCMSAGVDFASVPASSHDRWLSTRLQGYLIPGGLVINIIAYP